MFSFHKPKIYRSLHGCCICRAKSSSSRFTDSKRYENDFEMCFGIDEHRSGEICNACVLLVKRWKKLPKGSTRNWHHVVDARAGPGTKSMYKIKNRTKELPDDHSIMKKKHKHKHKHKKRPVTNSAVAALIHSNGKRPHSPSGVSDDIAMGDEGFSDNYPSRTPSPGNSDVSDDENDENRSQKSLPTKCSRRKQAAPSRFSSFLDLTYWKETEVCCGIIFLGASGEVMVDPRLFRPCRSCKPFSVSPTKPCSKRPQALPSPPKCSTRRKNSESGASSDSGVSTPVVDQDDMSLDTCMMYRSSDTPPPPTLEPELPLDGELPPRRLVPPFDEDDFDDLDDLDDSEDDDDDYMPTVVPHFLESQSSSSIPMGTTPSSLYRRHLGSSGAEKICPSVTNETAAAAAAVLDLSMGMSRQRFIPMQV